MNALASSFDQAVEELLQQVIGLQGNEDLLYIKHALVVEEIHGKLIRIHGEIPDIHDVVGEIMASNESIVETIAQLDFKTGRGSVHSCWETIDVVNRKFRIKGFSEKEAIYELWAEGINVRMEELTDIAHELLMERELAFTCDNWAHPIYDMVGPERGISVVVNDCQNLLLPEWQEGLILQYTEEMEVRCNWSMESYSETLYDLMMVSFAYPEGRV